MNQTPEQTSDLSRIVKWAEPMPDMGPAVYRLTNEEKEHKHTYHLFCPWSPDRNLLLLSRYDRKNPELEICVVDTDSGVIQVIDHSQQWDTHSAAFQQWLGDQNRILYRYCNDNGRYEFATVNPDGSGRKIHNPDNFAMSHASSDGQWVYGLTPHEVLFPDDKLTDRHDKGVLRYNLETGEQELVFSVEDAMKVIPQTNDYEDCHVHPKMLILHRKTGRIVFNLVNTFWDRDGTEPRIRLLITMNADGSEPACLGGVLHHPNWHSSDDRIICNVKDFNDDVRFGFYRGDGTGLLEYVPETQGSGHPTISPDGQWICTDAGSDKAGCDSKVILCDPVSGRELILAEYGACSDGYASFKKIDNRREGETVIQSLLEAKKSRNNWQTQAHPAWSRDGSAIIFNRDAGNGKGSQLYVIDVQSSIETLTRKS